MYTRIKHNNKRYVLESISSNRTSDKVMFEGSAYVLESIEDSSSVWENYLEQELGASAYRDDDDNYLGRLVNSNDPVKVLIKNADEVAFVFNGEIIGEQEYPEFSTWSEAVSRMKEQLPHLLTVASELSKDSNVGVDQLKSKITSLLSSN